MTQAKANKEKKQTVKVGFFGSSGSGKTQLSRALLTEEGLNKLPRFFQNHQPTQGFTFHQNVPSDIEGLQLELFDTAGELKFSGLTPMNINKYSDIRVICIDPNNPDSLVAAKEYAKKIAEVSGDNARTIIAITKTDNIEKAALEKFKGDVENLKREFGITFPAIITSAMNEVGIDELRKNISWLAGLAPGSDEVYLYAFKEQFIKHLKKDPEPNKENQPKNIVKEAKDTIGKLSRLFDALELPIVDRASFNKRIEKAGSTMAYMRPILNETAKMLLNKERTRLHDDVIAAIGIDNYKDIVNGVVVDGRVQAKPGEEKTFAEKEADVARNVMASIVTSYSLLLQDYNLSPEERKCYENNRRLFDQFSALKEKIKEVNDGKMPSYEKKASNVKELDLVQLNQKIAELNQQIAEIDLENVSKGHINELIKLVSEAESLNQAVNSLLSPKLGRFTEEIVQPLQVMATQFNLAMLDDPKSNISFEEITEKINYFYSMVVTSLDELDHQNVDKTDPSYKALTTLKDKLDSALQTDLLMPSASEMTKRDYVLNRYRDAVNMFVKNVNEDTLKVQPANVRGVFKRIWDAISNLNLSLFSYNAEEVQEKQRNKQQTKLKEELLSLKTEGEEAPTPEAPKYN
ncbi:hypothetical protein OQJ26_04065 [Legionella sp. PATHC038]|uniref:GTPase domain-containing protein n=1 Tax=Legionella sheltonii TaxID=2992041 RepID=UPI0022447452|nr:hypothetical protein [Legionella sp. PATHC038]MCW8397965.1 hypothetical protein [Legionella sp. PATHC038]